MPLDAALLQTAASTCDPRSQDSGTELIAPFIYSLIRMVRPRTIVELGSGYTTFFMLRALADNLEDVRREREVITERVRLLEGLPAGLRQAAYHGIWARAEGERPANLLDPHFHQTEYRPSLHCFEALPAVHVRSKALRTAIEGVGHSDLFTCHHGPFTPEAIPAEQLPVDLVFEDDDVEDYRARYEALWPSLNASGGMLLVHNVTSAPNSYAVAQWFQDRFGKELETLVVPEPHKLHQNGCVIFRRTTSYKPPFARLDPGGVLDAARAVAAGQGAPRNRL